MKNYQCHKQVKAAKIVLIDKEVPTKGDIRVVLRFEDGTEFAEDIGAKIFARYLPEVGDYFVIYKGGYMSISPAKEFEDGYTEIPMPKTMAEVDKTIESATQANTTFNEDAVGKELEGVNLTLIDPIIGVKTLSHLGSWYKDGAWHQAHFCIRQPEPQQTESQPPEKVGEVIRVANQTSSAYNAGIGSAIGSVQLSQEGQEIASGNIRFIERDHSKILQYKGQRYTDGAWREVWLDVPVQMETSING